MTDMAALQITIFNGMALKRRRSTNLFWPKIQIFIAISYSYMYVCYFETLSVFTSPSFPFQANQQ